MKIANGIQAFFILTSICLEQRYYRWLDSSSAGVMVYSLKNYRNIRQMLDSHEFEGVPVSFIPDDGPGVILVLSIAVAAIAVLCMYLLITK